MVSLSCEMVKGLFCFLMNESNCTEHHQKMEIFALVIS